MTPGDTVTFPDNPHREYTVVKVEGDRVYLTSSMNGLPPGPCCRATGESWCNAWRCTVTTLGEVRR
jgi:hypothetical protein